MASYRLGTSAVQAFKMPWELNMTHTVTGNTPGEVKKKKNTYFFRKPASPRTDSKGCTSALLKWLTNTQNDPGSLL